MNSLFQGSVESFHPTLTILNPHTNEDGTHFPLSQYFFLTSTFKARLSASLKVQSSLLDMYKYILNRHNCNLTIIQISDVLLKISAVATQDIWDVSTSQKSSQNALRCFLVHYLLYWWDLHTIPYPHSQIALIQRELLLITSSLVSIKDFGLCWESHVERVEEYQYQIPPPNILMIHRYFI